MESLNNKVEDSHLNLEETNSLPEISESSTKPKRYRYIFIAVVAVLFVFGMISNDATVSTRSLLNSQTEEIRATPFGPLPSYCIRKIPEGKSVRANKAGLTEILDMDMNVESTHQPDPRCAAHLQSIQAKKEVKLQLKAESERIASEHDLAVDSTVTSFSTISGWLDYVYYYPTNYVESFSADYVVPSDPPVNNGQVLFYFIGIENLNSAVVTILQPVLTYNNGITGWNMASWNCCPNGEAWESSSISGLATGDVLHGKIKVESTNAHVTSKVISKADGSAAGETVTLTVATNSRNFDWMDVTLEVYGVSNCEEFPASKMKIHKMTATDASENIITPTWSDASGTTDCSGTQTYSEKKWQVIHQNSNSNSVKL